MFIFSPGVCVSFINSTHYVGLVFLTTTSGQAYLKMSLAQFRPRRNPLMALEKQQDVWNCSPTEGGSEGE